MRCEFLVYVNWRGSRSKYINGTANRLVVSGLASCRPSSRLKREEIQISQIIRNEQKEAEAVFK